MESLEGKIALVTGSSRGIGRAIALELAREGADVIVNYRRNARAAEDVVSEIHRMGRRAVAIEANMSDPGEIQRLFRQTVDTLGGLDLLICNAATGYLGNILDQSVKNWDLCMNVNVRSAMLCAQAGFPLMKARGGGRIVLITSPGADRVIPQYAAVGVSKAALNALTRYLSVELAPHGILVNAICPGLVDTEALRYYPHLAENLRKAEEISPVGRAVRPGDVAQAVAFLCGSKARMLCGEIISVDGGLFHLFPIVQGECSKPGGHTASGSERASS